MAGKGEAADVSAQIDKHSFVGRKKKELALFAIFTGMSAVGGFGYAVAAAKKQDPNMFNQGLISAAGKTESGGALALRALGIGSLYAVGGVSVVCFAVWKLVGAKNMIEFREKIRSCVPSAPRNEPQGKNDFKNVEELVNYIINDGGKKGS